MNIRRLTSDDLLRLRQFWSEQWDGEFVVAHGTIYRPEDVDGFIIEKDNEWVGLITFVITKDECEITSLDSLCEDQGVGINLINTVADEALNMNCKRLWLITTTTTCALLAFINTSGLDW